MVSKDEIQKLKSENELLQIQLQDITEMIHLREEELEILRKKAGYSVLLQSTLEGNLEEIRQLQRNIGDEQKKAQSAAKREAATEEEFIESLKMEKEFYNIKDKYESSRAAIRDLDNELAETSGMYRQLAASISRIAELESSLEIARMQNEYLTDQLSKMNPPRP